MTIHFFTGVSWLLSVFYTLKVNLQIPGSLKHVVFTRKITYLLPPWSRVLLEKLTGSQLVKKLPTFY